MAKWNRGYLYIAYKDKRYFEQAEISARSLREVDPEAHITLMGDRDWDSDVFDKQKRLQQPKKEELRDNVYETKFYNIPRTPYQQTFLVDTDTYFLANCRELFELLDFYDFAIAQANAYLPLMGPMEKPMSGTTPFNSGIMLFDNNYDVQEVFKDTYTNFLDRRSIHKTKRFDIYFTYTLMMNSAKVWTLPSIFNARVGSHISLSGPVKILHSAGQKMMNAKEFEEIGWRMNAHEGSRTWDPKTRHLNGE